MFAYCHCSAPAGMLATRGDARLANEYHMQGQGMDLPAGPILRCGLLLFSVNNHIMQSICIHAIHACLQVCLNDTHHVCHSLAMPGQCSIHRQHPCRSRASQRAQGAHRVYDIVGALPLLLVGYLRAYHTVTRWVVGGPYPTWTSSSLISRDMRLLLHPQPDHSASHTRHDTIAMAQPG